MVAQGYGLWLTEKIELRVILLLLVTFLFFFNYRLICAILKYMFSSSL